MRKVIEILREIESNSARTAKENIIKGNKDNDLFIEVLKFSFNDYIVTGLSSKKINKVVSLDTNEELNTLEEMMEYLKANNTGTDRDIKVIQNFINKQDEDLREVLKNIATKNLKLGATAKTINKVLGDIIQVFNVMLAEKLVENIDRIEGKEFIVTKKLDGNRCIIFRDDKRIYMYSRSGQLLEGFGELEKELMDKLPEDIVFDGELLLRNTKGLNSKELFQETQKVIRKKGEKKDIEFHIFDMLPLNEFQKGISSLSCLDRKNQLHELLDGVESDLLKEVVMLYVGKDIQEAYRIMDELVEQGEEGIMINLADAKYECKRVKHLLKGKKMQTCDCEIIGFEEGKNKNKGTLGAVIIDYKGFSVGVGSGYTDEMRKYIWSNREKLIGRVIEVQYFEETANKDGGISIRFPVFKCLREEGKEVSYY